MRGTSSRGTRRRGLRPAAIALAVPLARRHRSGGSPLLRRGRPHHARAGDHGADPATATRPCRSEACNTAPTSCATASGGNRGDPQRASRAAQTARSLAYFGQLTDFQLADEESPARVEFLDGSRGLRRGRLAPAGGAAPVHHRLRDPPDEPGSPAQPGGAGRRRRARRWTSRCSTGDQADNMQRNEGVWTRDLLEGGAARLQQRQRATRPTTTRSRIRAAPPTRRRPATSPRPRSYTGVQDYDDYPGARTPYFYDPDDVQGTGRRGLASYPGLMDRAQQLAVRSRRAWTCPATSPTATTTGWCRATRTRTRPSRTSRPAASRRSARRSCRARRRRRRTASTRSALLTPSAGMLVPPDPLRRFVAKTQLQADLQARTAVDDGARLRLRRPGRGRGLQRRAPPTTPGTRRRRRASASSRSTRCPRAASSEQSSTATSTTRSSSGSSAS